MIDTVFLERVVTFKCLGVIMHENVTWSDHIDTISKKVNQTIGVIRRVKHLLPLSARIFLYKNLVVPLFDYADVIWGDKFNDTLISKLQILQNRAAKLLLDRPKYSSASEAINILNMGTLSSRRR